MVKLQDIARHVEELEYEQSKDEPDERVWLRDLILNVGALIIGKLEMRVPEFLASNIIREHTSLPKRQTDYAKKLQIQLSTVEQAIYQ